MQKTSVRGFQFLVCDVTEKEILWFPSSHTKIISDFLELKTEIVPFLWVDKWMIHDFFEVLQGMYKKIGYKIYNI